MKKYLILAAFAAVALGACTKVETTKETVDEPLTFGVYAGNAATKATYGDITTDNLKTSADGFGVFAYYTKEVDWATTDKPNFMYNQKVEYKTIGGTSVWTYEPIKYWPNEYGAEASSEAADRLTFFAYAPYAAVTPSTGLVTGDATSGIIGMSRNIATGDPLVMYEANLTPGSGVDLCWGVAAADFTSSVDGNNNNVDRKSVV